MPHRNVYHMVPHADAWAVRLEGSSSFSATAASRGAALDEAAGFLRLLGAGRVVVHDADGRIEAGYSLGSLATRDDHPWWAWAAVALGAAFVVGLGVAVAARRSA